MRKLALAGFVLAVIASFPLSTAYAKPEYGTAFTAAYPNTKGTPLAACVTCHTATMDLNSYGAALKAANMDLAAVESKDSDGDGATNASEIAALTFPGDPASKPPGTGGSGGSTGSGGTTGSGGSGGTSGSAGPSTYLDISGNPAQAAIEALVKAGILTGEGYYRPNALITRVEFACLLQRLFHLPGTSAYLPAFADVPKTHWAYQTVEAISRSGLLAPAGADTFNPAGKVERATAARSACIALGHRADMGALGDADVLAYAAGLGLFADGSGPGTAITRGEAAILVNRLVTAKAGLVDPLAGVTDYAIGPDQCAKCHSDVADKVAGTMHSRMVRPMGPGATTANFDDPAAPIKASDVLFVVGTNDTNYFVGKDYNYLPASWSATTNSWGTRGVSSWLNSCAQCHTTGYDKALGSFVALDITCESCHGGGAKHVASGDPARINATVTDDACASCHGGERQVGQIAETGHFTALTGLLEGYSKDNCLECHSATAKLAADAGQTPPTVADFKTGDHKTDTAGVTCVVCHDPHDSTNEAQLRDEPQETCVQCHTGELAAGATFKAGSAVHHPQKEMWQGTGAYGVETIPSAKTATCVDCHMTNGNHYFKVGTPTVSIPVHGKPTEFNTCASCHTGMTAAKIEGLFAAFEARIEALNTQLAQVDAHIANEVSFGRDMSAAKALRDQAYTNIAFATADGSKGMHNPAYVTAMLDAAERLLAQALTAK